MPGPSLAVVDQATTVLQKVQEYIDAGMDTTIDVTSEIVDQEKDDDQIDNKIKEMQDVMLQYISMDQELKNVLDATKHVKQFVRDGGEILDMEAELDKKIASLKEGQKNQSLESHRKFQELTEKVHELMNAESDEDETPNPATEPTGDEDLAITQGDINTKCPYTGKVMVNPVKNRHCGHYYDKAGIQELCKKRSKPKCPIPGCVNEKPISMDDVEEDKKMKKYIESLHKKEKRGKNGKKK